MVNIALVGCAHIHTPGFVDKIKARAGTVQVKAIWDPTPARAQHWHKELPGSTIVNDPGAVWADSAITAAVICSETNRHENLAVAGAQAGKHLFIEKPLGMGAKDSLAMAAAVQKAGVKFQTGYFLRGQATLQFLKKEIEAGRLGTITRARGSNCHMGALGDWFCSKPNDPAKDWRWMADPKIAGCGAFGDLATHVLDLLLWLVGDVDRVTGQVRSVIHRYENCDESGEALLHFKNGALGTLAGGWVDVANPNMIEISGTEGHAAINHGQLYYTNKNVPGADGKTPFPVPADLAWPHAFDLFLDSLQGKPATLVSVQEAARRPAVMEAIYTAARENRWVNVD